MTALQHPWLLGILCGSPVLTLLLIRLWSIFGAPPSGNPSGLALFYWCGLIVLASGTGMLLTQGAAVLLNQSLVIPRFVVIICCLPILVLFVFSLFNKVGGLPNGRTIYEWILFIICLICLPILFTLIWRQYGSTFTIGETLTVSIDELARFYVPWFVFFWSLIFSVLNVVAYGMGGEMLHPASTISEAIVIILKPLLQYETCVLISLRSSLGLTAIVLVLCETFRMLTLFIRR
jgi:hypothetical protein